jgi:biotin transport system substrate-specific component
MAVIDHSIRGFSPMLVRPNSLAAALVPRATSDFVGAAILVVAGSLLLTLSAKVQVPFYPVPMTMQSLVVLCLGATLGARLGAAAVGLYLLEGALGLPVFAGTPEKGVGLAYMMGPTGGYLLGFLLAAPAVGWLAERGWDRSHLRMLAAMALGHAIIFLFGYLWLTYLIGADKAWTAGVALFSMATLFKTALGATMIPATWKLLERRS